MCFICRLFREGSGDINAQFTMTVSNLSSAVTGIHIHGPASIAENGTKLYEFPLSGLRVDKYGGVFLSAIIENVSTEVLEIAANNRVSRDDLGLTSRVILMKLTLTGAFQIVCAAVHQCAYCVERKWYDLRYFHYNMWLIGFMN